MTASLFIGTQPRLFRLVAALICLGCFSATASGADLIEKLNGQKIKCQVVKETEDSVQVKISFPGGSASLTVPKDQIHAITTQGERRVVNKLPGTADNPAAGQEKTTSQEETPAPAPAPTAEAEEENAGPEKITAIMDFSKPAHRNLRDRNGGRFIPSDDGGGTCLEVPLFYSKKSAIVGAFSSLKLPVGEQYRVGPYSYIDFEVYYEADEEPGIYFDIGGRHRGIFQRCQVMVSRLKPGVWQSKTVHLINLYLRSYRNGDKKVPLPGDEMQRISIYADNGKTRGVKRLLVRNFRFYEVDPYAAGGEKAADMERLTMTPLHLAALASEKEKAATLIEGGADVTLGNAVGHTALHMTGHSGSVEIAKLLIDKGANVNRPDRFRDITPLHTAALHGQPEIVKLLLDSGADAQATLKNGMVPLEWALNSGQLECVKALVEHTATAIFLNEKLPTDKLPLEIAREFERKTLEAYILEHIKNNKRPPKIEADDEGPEEEELF